VDVAVLEAQGRVGGRLLSEPLGDGKVVEHGGQYAGPPRDGRWIMDELVRSLGAEMFPTHDEGDRLLEAGGRLVRYSGLFPRSEIVAIVDLARAKRRLDAMSVTVPLSAPWAAERAREWDAQSFETWLRANLRSRRGRALFASVSEAIWATSMSEISLLHVLTYVHSVARGHFSDLPRTRGGVQQEQIVGGAQSLAWRIASELGERVVLESPVRRVEHPRGGVTVAGDGFRASARRLVVALPPVLAGRLVYDPPLPGARDQLTQRMANGSVIKASVVYDGPFWRAAGLVGQVGSDSGHVRAVFDTSPPPDARPGVLQAFVVGEAARDLGRRQPAERRHVVLDALARWFGPRARSPERYLEKDWSEDEWARGCFHCYAPPGVWTQHGPALRAPVGRVHWAGTETAVHGLGTMAGAVDAGERAAAEVLAAEPALGARALQPSVVSR
jgi:monoamine oxidase